ncbi:MAG: putative repeat protein (TIGR01451 family) [Oleispira sp.]|jgi:uncharacterized repeat protein (TIGR01451 family)
MFLLSVHRFHVLQNSCSGVRERILNNSKFANSKYEHTHKLFNAFAKKYLMSVFVLFCLFFTVPAYALKAGNIIDSDASVHYRDNGQFFSKSTNAPFVVESATNAAPSAPGTPSAIDVWGPVSNPNSNKNFSINQSKCRSGTSHTTYTQLSYANGSALNLPATMPSQQSDVFKAGNPLIIRIVDLDENVDNAHIDTVIVTLTSTDPTDSEELVLYETSIDNGEFVGIIQTTANDSVSLNDCDLALTPSSILSIGYQDLQNAEDSQNKILRFDPYSKVFNAFTGKLIDGITLRLVKARTGELAQVFGDDGISAFPAEIVSGKKVQDSSGKTYNFPTGSYRFPYVSNGNYRIEVNHSFAFRFPAETPDQIIQTLPSAPYLLNDASRGLAKSSQNLLLSADIPLDPLSDRILLDKSSTKTKAGIGDFVPFEITMTNIDADITDIKLIDTLPIGLKFIKGSLKVNDKPYTDISIDSDGQLIVVNFPVLTSLEFVNISYLSQVSTNATGRITNIVEISHPILKSNIATASIDIRDDLMREKSQLLGRIILDDCDGNLDAEGLSGVRILMEDGRYAVSDEEGQWHFEGISAGTHVIQLDITTLPSYLELATCDDKFLHAGQSYSQFIDIQLGTLWRVDFHVQPKKPENGDVLQTLLNELIPLNEEERFNQDASPVDKKIIYTANIGGSGVALNNVVEEIRLPDGAVLKDGSLTLDGAPFPYDYRNNIIFVRLGDKPKQWTHEIKFSAFISPTAKKGTLSASAILHYDIGPLLKDSTPLAETRVILFLPPANDDVNPLKNPKFESLSNVLTVQDKNNLSDLVYSLNGLKNLEISVTGHTDNVRIAKRHTDVFANNQVLSETRATAVAEYISQQINLPLDKIKIAGLGQSNPLQSNKTKDGRAKNRRVEVRILNAAPDLAVVSLDIDVQLAKTQTLIPGLDLSESTASGNVNNPESQIVVKQQPVINQDWFVGKGIEKNWVWPPKGYSPDISATNILVQHPKNTRIRLILKGVPVHSIYFEGIEQATDKAVAVSEWRGINIDEGENQFVAEILDRNDTVIDALAHSVYFSGAPAQVDIVPEMSNLLADGLQVPIIAVRLKDKNGYAVRKNTQGEIHISEPFQLLQRSEYDTNPLNDTDKLSYRVEGDGIAFIRLQPTTQTGALTITFNQGNGIMDEVRSWLKPAPRDWILVGLGELSIGANNASRDASNNSNGLIDENIFHQGRLAFYTRGQIPGDYLVTAAYDSNKKETTPFATLVQPGEYYTLYADASQQGQDARSGNKLYVKIEKERFYALYGDINTGLDTTRLARYVRNLTGAQVVYQDDLLALSGFASEADSTFVRDEIPANGTSGLYKLSNQSIVLNSESIRIETRDRLNNQIILATKTLQRFLDYSLNDSDGSLYFKFPIAATDNAFNPIYIVADYETENVNRGHLLGGRAGIKLLDDTFKAGITVIDENNDRQSNQLNALDATLGLGNLTISAEIAQTRPRNENAAEKDKKNASAKKLAATLRTSKADITAYTQRIDKDFGLNQQNQADLDQQSTGVDATLYINDNNKLDLESLYQTQISTGFDKQLASATLTHNVTDSRSINAGLNSNMQETSDGTRFVDALSLGGSAQALSQDLRLNITATTDITERSEDDDRIKLGAEYRWTDSLTTFADYERSFNANHLERTALGLRTQPWQGGQAEQLLVQERQNDGYRLYSESGLSHDWKVDKHWLVSFGFNQSKNLEQTQPAEQGISENFNAISTGWGYRSDQWQWTNRLERRMASSSHVHSARTSLYHPLSRSMAIGGSIDFYKQSTKPGYEQTISAILDFAIRPYRKPFAILLQTRWLQDSLSTASLSPTNRSRRVINNAHLNWQFNRRHQLSTQYGFKRILDQYSNEDYASSVHYIAGEWRHQLSDTLDIGTHGRELINVGEQKQNSYGLSIGIRPVKNLWTSIGFNVEGFIDNDFSAANYTAHGVYLKLRFKADQDTLSSVRQAFTW